MFTNDLELQAAIARTVNHKDIAGVARDFSPQTPMLPEALKSTNLAVPAELITLARAFNKLQDKRHEADYDLSAEYTRPEARAIVDAAKKLFSDWEQARKKSGCKNLPGLFPVEENLERKALSLPLAIHAVHAKKVQYSRRIPVAATFWRIG